METRPFFQRVKNFFLVRPQHITPTAHEVATVAEPFQETETETETSPHRQPKPRTKPKSTKKRKRVTAHKSRVRNRKSASRVVRAAAPRRARTRQIVATLQPES